MTLLYLKFWTNFFMILKYIILWKRSHIVLSNKPQPAILQQTRKITGRILDENGEPLIGVSVMLKGTSNGTITNIDGDYTLSGDITDKSVLEVTYIGMKKQEITVGNRTRINITMTSDNEMLDEVIVVGYGTQKVNLSGAVESVGGGWPISNQ